MQIKTNKYYRINYLLCARKPTVVTNFRREKKSSGGAQIKKKKSRKTALYVIITSSADIGSPITLRLSDDGGRPR